MGRAGRKIRPRGHFRMSFLASYRKRLSGTRLLIGSALAGGINAAPIERTEDISVGIVRFGGDRVDVDARNRFILIDLRLDHLPVVRLSSRDREVQNNADLVIGSVLLVSGLQPQVSGISGHCRIRIASADLLVLAALPALPLGLAFIFALILAQHTRLQNLGAGSGALIGPNSLMVSITGRFTLWRSSYISRLIGITFLGSPVVDPISPMLH